MPRFPRRRPTAPVCTPSSHSAASDENVGPASARSCTAACPLLWAASHESTSARSWEVSDHALRRLVPSHRPVEDPWLTLAEFAEAMRVRPVTVRWWIAKGQLAATRGGQRKWLVRRSELERMLAQGQGLTPAAAVVAPPPAPAGWTVGSDVPEEVLADQTEQGADFEQSDREQWLALASYEWDVALELSRMAPPMPGSWLVFGQSHRRQLDRRRRSESAWARRTSRGPRSRARVV